MTSTCNYDGCTVDDTGSCALERAPATCEHRVGNEVTEGDAEPVGVGDQVDDAGILGAPVLEDQEGTLAFPTSRTLGPEVISAMMAERYVTLVGILGDPESGKTACLASLYLLVANACLTGWSFADSKSLMGFEEIARGARDWNEGQIPEQMTVHTEMADERRPGFLHLRLVRETDGRRVDLALPDLPGEWTTELVKSSRMDRLEWMTSAEVVWVVLDGRTLANKETRQGVVTRVGQLGGRLKTLFGGVVPKIILVVTHRDQCELPDSVLGQLSAELAKRDLTATPVQVAPFSDTDLKAGFGIAELIDATTGGELATQEFWPARRPQTPSRAYIAFRRGG